MDTPDWLDHRALEELMVMALARIEDETLGRAFLAAIERGDGSLHFFTDERGAWVGVKVMGLRLFQAHRSRVQKAGCN
jgi:hypothetical protein